MQRRAWVLQVLSYDDGILSVCTLTTVTLTLCSGTLRVTVKQNSEYIWMRRFGGKRSVRGLWPAHAVPARWPHPFPAVPSDRRSPLPILIHRSAAPGARVDVVAMEAMVNLVRSKEVNPGAVNGCSPRVQPLLVGFCGRTAHTLRAAVTKQPHTLLSHYCNEDTIAWSLPCWCVILSMQSPGGNLAPMPPALSTHVCSLSTHGLPMCR